MKLFYIAILMLFSPAYAAEITPDQILNLSGSNTGDESQHMIIRIDDGATLAVADDVEVIGIQTAITITTAKLWCAITPVTTSITVDITDDTTTILSGFLEVEPTYFDSDDATPAVTVLNGSIVANSKLAVNVETTGTGTTGGGCSIWIEYNET